METHGNIERSKKGDLHSLTVLTDRFLLTLKKITPNLKIYFFQHVHRAYNDLPVSNTSYASVSQCSTVHTVTENGN